jgi:glycosyltransferase involved in cell wall biosynthesis
MTSATADAPLVTVVVTTHDRPELAVRAVDSALSQTVEDLEVVVVDDGSTPPFAPSLDDVRVRIVRHEHAGGVCAARNRGMAEARGAWITFLDDDDELDPRMLERALDAARRSVLPEPVAVMTGLVIVAPDGTDLGHCEPPVLRKGEHYLLEGRGDLRAQNSLVIPTAVARAIGGWDEDFELFEGDDFGIRLNLAASIQPCEGLLYRLTQHGNARLTGRQRSIPRDMERTLSKHGVRFREHPRAYAKYMSTLGIYHLRVGDWAAAVRWTLRAVARDPRRGRSWLFAAAALAGPYALRAARRIRPPESGLPLAVLMERRARKYARRLSNYPRAAVAVPVAAITRASMRTLGASDADGARAVLLVCIYRHDNAPLVAPIVEDAIGRGWGVRLWALDRVAPPLARHTIGVGAGAKFPLLAGLVRAAGDVDDHDWVVVTDDDVSFDRGRAAELIAVAEGAGLDLVQPAHVELSHRDNEITLRRPLSVARRTTFVEIGPVFAVRRPWAGCVTSTFEHHTMGWGLELEWADLMTRGLRMGIIDVVPVRHLRPAGKAYDWKAQHARLRTMLADRGYASLQESQRTLATWRPWHARPPWSDRRVS